MNRTKTQPLINLNLNFMADADADGPNGPKYAHAIPSLFQTIPTLPVLGDLDVNHSILANTLLDPANLTNARLVAKKMKSAFGKSSMKAAIIDFV